VLERYRTTLLHRLTPAGRPVSWGAQAQHLVAVRSFLTWCTRQHLVPYNAAQELELPRQPRRLPRAVLSASEAERVLAMPDLSDPLGLRDRAILETVYSTGLQFVGGFLFPYGPEMQQTGSNPMTYVAQFGLECGSWEGPSAHIPLTMTLSH
jgi:hypothetical protein